MFCFFKNIANFTMSIKTQNNMGSGALFYKADLHIHSYGDGTGSYDVTDMTNTPEAIVNTTLDKGLALISITDHNEISNSITAVKYSKTKGILVVPGVEVSTIQGHLLLYFETIEQLRQFYGGLSFSSDKTICEQGIVECLNKAKLYDGVGVLAHISLDSGFEKTVGRFGPQMEAIFKCDNLLGLEISHRSEVDLYTDNDTSSERKHLLEIWRKYVGNEFHQNLAKLMSSDSHSLKALGKNADGETKLTRIKMPDMTFRSFVLSLKSSESRIRLEDTIPEQRPVIKYIKVVGGLLDGLDTELSPNLTCIIGSRGAGKSTLLESIREGSGNHSKSRLRDSDVWPQSINIGYCDETNRNIVFQRDKNSNVVNRTDPIAGIGNVPIESYGQGETANTIQHSEEDPKVIIDFLDGFVDLRFRFEQDYKYIEQLRSNQSDMAKLRINLIALPEAKRALVNETKKLETLKQTKAADLVIYHEALIKEREFRKNLIEELSKLITTYRNILGDRSIFEIVSTMSDDSVIVGKDYFSSVKSIVSQFSKVVESKAKELNNQLEEKVKELKTQLKLWEQKESEIQTKIDAKKEELSQKGIPFDLGKINQISKNIIDYEKKVKSLQEDQKRLQELQAERAGIIGERIENKREIYRMHYNFAEKINKELKNSIEDFYINVKYSESLYSPEFESILKELMGWRTSQVPKSNIIAKSISVYDFVKAITKKDENAIRSITNNGCQLLGDDEIRRMINILNEDYKFEDLECVVYDDLPVISVTKRVIDSNGRKVTVSRKLSQLSLGQQQSVLLGILLLSDSRKPLLIDQPEDNLDSEFIFKTIVANLRKAKEHRQIIVVTHNPNIAVLGDAELIIPLKSTNNHSIAISPGSIDNPDTVNLCCQILEGGESAFKQRQNIYNL